MPTIISETSEEKEVALPLINNEEALLNVLASWLRKDLPEIKNETPFTVILTFYGEGGTGKTTFAKAVQKAIQTCSGNDKCVNIFEENNKTIPLPVSSTINIYCSNNNGKYEEVLHPFDLHPINILFEHQYTSKAENVVESLSNILIERLAKINAPHVRLSVNNFLQAHGISFCKI